MDKAKSVWKLSVPIPTFQKVSVVFWTFALIIINIEIYAGCTIIFSVGHVCSCLLMLMHYCVFVPLGERWDSCAVKIFGCLEHQLGTVLLGAKKKLIMDTSLRSDFKADGTCHRYVRS
ncbi:hypothetical protein POJ06DRAFT_147352 [Lipomyces tetrasporus]|uniref:Uncharacterized protein n=1 Tax=Lipomyces tetrasporus TaxID=54092 RepID=A0AAD7QNB7_9ASCO|nr:uncharacterized protein POJ06DRAFT_147352 [Lipomyces tetrasporus]KAJ8098223.1 hypothetical protein POJ06DRAFT_147352 [Lipomyces tetrasporus]